jgi:hypothetical protein
MSAWLELHTVLSLRLDATEAYRLMHNYRDEELAKAAAPADGQAYDGELAMLRGLIRTLRVVVRPDQVDVAEVRRLLHEHATDDAAAREEGPQKYRAAEADTLSAWLYRRFMPHGVGWDNLDEGDRSYWEHQARAVRRAVARGGFKADVTEGGDR